MNAVRQIVERANLDGFTEQVVDSFWDHPDFQRFRPLREDLRAWVRWNIDLVIGWLVEGRAPSDADLEVFRERARMLALKGVPPDIVPANFRRGARYAWTALLQAARDDERPALLESADLLFDYIDRVSQVFSDAYESVGAPSAVSDEERRARGLMERTVAGAEPTGEDLELAERLGFDLAGAHRPFVLAGPAWPADRHLALAAALRARSVLAASEGRRVTGLSQRPVAWLEDGAVIAQGPRTRRGDLDEAFDELRVVADVALRSGRSGAVDPDDYLAELLLRRSPRLGARLRARVRDRLAAHDPELIRTLDALVEHDFDRAGTAASLPVHRNTLTNRLARVREITGLDVDSAEGRGLVWLAWLEGRAAR